MFHDKVGIAAEVQRDWGGVIGDRFFSPWQESTGIRPYIEPQKVIMLDGFDPGHSIENPASWWAAAFDMDRNRLQIVGYWMAADTFAEWWVPFFKRWHPRVLERATVISGKFAGATFKKAFEKTQTPYSPDVLEMMERVSEFRLPMVGGDKSGTHRYMTESPYDRLYDYNINVHQEYTSSREELCRKGREWSARTTIDDAIAEVTPMSPLGHPYPSPRAIFQGAKPKPYSGQGEYKMDVDKQEPRHVIQGADSYFYLVPLLDGDIRARAQSGGEFQIDEYQRNDEPVYYGGLDI
jgi:hypothetical protein